MTINFSAYREALQQIETALGLTDAEQSAIRMLGGGPNGIAYKAREKGRILHAAKAGIYRLAVIDVIREVDDEIYQLIDQTNSTGNASELTANAIDTAIKKAQAMNDIDITQTAQALFEIEASGRQLSVRDVLEFIDYDQRDPDEFGVS